MAYQKKHGYTSATATVKEGNVVKEAKLFDMDSTYLTKGRGEMFKAGDRYPWKARQGYFQDMWRSTYGSLNDDMVRQSQTCALDHTDAVPLGVCIKEKTGLRYAHV